MTIDQKNHNRLSNQVYQQQPQPQPQQQQHGSHAFGGYESGTADSDYADDDDDDDDDDEAGPGFGVYKDQPTNRTHYTNLSTRPSSSQTFDNQTRRTSQSSRVPLYPPQPILSPTSSNPHSPLRSNFNVNSSNSQYFNNPPLSPVKPNDRDLVPIPALGSDWEKDEGRRDREWDGKPKLKILDKSKLKNNTVDVLVKRLDDPKRRFNLWIRGDHSYWGWFNRWMGLSVVALLLLLATLLLIFLIPRQPSLLYNNQSLMNSDNLKDVKFNRNSPNSFEFQTKMNLALDGRNSYANFKVHSLQATIKDLWSTDGQAVDVARADRLEDGSDSLTVDHKKLTPFDLRMKFSYTANSKNDTLWNNWYASCGHIWPGNSTRPKLSQLGLIVKFKVSGLIGKEFSERTLIKDIDCPVELPANAA
ncbi:hypothetical protein BY996DRAFT_6735087 [Phakopsora pachyrhizi]|uniref:Expressed protein n=1 Tax=Phakopsora pachyrhizi TaxID=170000 RepID=A0AAV0AET6_PHAPC|nr:hypothetical protein BY996DRAFT_6735087 [Phakopsora pachyrhizi]CAH7665727.1 expressed protein [Phakopsora pachyrhizi]